MLLSTDSTNTSQPKAMKVREEQIIKRVIGDATYQALLESESLQLEEEDLADLSFEISSAIICQLNRYFYLEDD